MMKKSIVTVACLLMSLFCLASCSSSPTTLNVAATAEKLSTSLTFQDQMTHLDRDAALNLYDLQEKDVKDVSLYVGTNATAEEISVWEGTDQTAAQTIKKAVETRVANQKESFVDYNPQEMPKLESPVIITKGNYVVLCLSNENDKAKEIINSSFQ